VRDVKIWTMAEEKMLEKVSKDCKDFTEEVLNES
jgi:phage gp46-like protein